MVGACLIPAWGGVQKDQKVFGQPRLQSETLSKKKQRREKHLLQTHTKSRTLPPSLCQDGGGGGAGGVSPGAKEWTLCLRYTGHCPLLRFSMGQTYGQVTGQLLRGPPGLAWPPAHRTLLPPIQSPRSPVISRGRLPPRRGHERLSSGVIPGYTGVYSGPIGCPLTRACVLN